MTAAAELAATRGGPGTEGSAHLVCTMGTPSDLETAAIGALIEAGWRVAVRADFDGADQHLVRMAEYRTPMAPTTLMGRVRPA